MRRISGHKYGVWYIAAGLSTLILFTEIIQANAFSRYPKAIAPSAWQCTLAQESAAGAMNALLPGIQHNVGVQCYSVKHA